MAELHKNVYVCMRCGMLLIRRDVRYIKMDRIEIGPDGLDCDDSDNDEYEDGNFCPSCDNNDKEGTLKILYLSQSICAKLRTLWDDLRKEDDSDERLDYGIPVDNSRLTELLAIELL